MKSFTYTFTFNNHPINTEIIEGLTDIVDVDYEEVSTQLLEDDHSEDIEDIEEYLFTDD